MVRRKHQFKPDSSGAGILNKLYIPIGRRMQILKWTLYSLLFLVTLVIQDSVTSKYRIFDGVIDLAPAVVILVAMFQGSQSGSVFALITSMIYVFAGTGPGYFAFFLLTLYASVASVFREEFLRRSTGSSLLCSAVALLLYEMSIFGVGLLFGATHTGRVYAFLMTSLLSILVMPVLYPIVENIGKIGGETWKE